jgi:hypothetical protein
MLSWIERAFSDGDFTIYNLPWGVCRKRGTHDAGAICVRIDAFAVDLREWSRSVYDLDADILDSATVSALEQARRIQLAEGPYPMCLRCKDSVHGRYATM